MNRKNLKLERMLMALRRQYRRQMRQAAAELRAVTERFIDSNGRPAFYRDVCDAMLAIQAIDNQYWKSRAEARHSATMSDEERASVISAQLKADGKEAI